MERINKIIEENNKLVLVNHHISDPFDTEHGNDVDY